MPEKRDPRVRLDKWLYAARFYKTRSIAAQAIEAGRARVDDQRVKPSHAVKAGTRISLSKDALVWKVEVAAVSDKRGPASEAAKAVSRIAGERGRARGRNRETQSGRRERTAHLRSPDQARPTQTTFVPGQKLAESLVREVENEIWLLVSAPHQVTQRGDRHQRDHPPRPVKRGRFRHAAALPPEWRVRH
jgi:ribosome-associated heat shock protein Hsp15